MGFFFSETLANQNNFGKRCPTGLMAIALAHVSEHAGGGPCVQLQFVKVYKW